MLEEYLQPKIRQKKKTQYIRWKISGERGGDSPLDFEQTEFRKSVQSGLSALKSGTATADPLS